MPAKRKTIKEKVLSELKTKTQTEIATCQIMIDFYEKRAETQSTEDAAKTRMKAEQIKGSLEFNTAFDEYLQSL